MKNNELFQRALRALSHPVMLCAIGLMLLNDHLLRLNWPSWWTGKLSDVAWLAFFPLVLAAVLSLIFPRREKAVEIGAITLTGFVFTLGKTIPAIHALIVAALEMVLPYPIGLRLDPTDLIALPALLIGWWVWEQSARRQRSTRWGWVPLAVGVIGSLGNAPMPMYGADCLTVLDNGALVVPQEYPNSYLSNDGGITWEAVLPESVPGYESCESHPDVWTITDHQQVIYRFTRGGPAIEESTDGGETWSASFSFTGMEARVALYSRMRSGAYAASAGPFDAIVDPGSGNLVVAMGYDGVLVRDPSGEWQWVTVGPFYHDKINTADELSHLLFWEAMLALIIAFAAAVGIYALRARRRWWVLILAAVSLIAALILSLTSPAINWTPSNYLAIPFAGVMIVAGIVELVGVGFALIDTLKKEAVERKGLLLALGILTVLIVIVFIVPFILWALGTIAHYGTAQWIAWLPVVALMIGGWFVIRRIFPIPSRPEKTDNGSSEESSTR
ncbi:MAG: hypothetical protein JXJ17_02950 [Anaerolineae bacterium]|nr:hypothetical protein [Anaerolineae bacterium]